MFHLAPSSYPASQELDLFGVTFARGAGGMRISGSVAAMRLIKRLFEESPGTITPAFGEAPSLVSNRRPASLCRSGPWQVTGIGIGSEHVAV